MKFVFATMGMAIYGLDLYNLETAFSVRYELKSNKKNDGVEIPPFKRQVAHKKWDIWQFER